MRHHPIWPALALAALACGGGATEPEGVTVEIDGPEVVAREGGLCQLELTATAQGERSAEADWRGDAVFYRTDDPLEPERELRRLDFEQVVDLWGSSRIRGGETLESRYVPPVPAPEDITVRAVFLYLDRTTGEVRSAEHTAQCVG